MKFIYLNCGMKITVLQYFEEGVQEFGLPSRRGEERFREEGETAQKIGGGGRKDAKK